MQQQHFYIDPYCSEFRTSIIDIIENKIVTENTIFYPAGGGQPGDKGWIDIDGHRLEIVDTRYSSDRIHIEHILHEPLTVEVRTNHEVTLYLDWELRYKHMRMHSCLHLLCHLIKDPVTGGNVGAEQSRAEFDLSEPVDKLELEAQLNNLIQQGAEITTQWLPEKVLDQQPELVRTMSVQPPRGKGEIRMVKVEGLDFQPCGGTHVRQISEIGAVRIPSIKSKGKQNKRINIVFAD